MPAHVLALGLIAGAYGAAAPVSPAAAAPVPATAPSTAGTRTVGAAPVALTQPADPYAGTITPTASAAREGMFGPQVRFPLIPLQAVLMPNGRLVSFGSPLGIAAQKGLSYDEWNPALGTGTGSHDQTPSMHDYDSFCSGMVRLPDGRLVMIGGNSAMSTMIFDPARQQQVGGSSLARQRWYASTLRLADDRILALGGADYYNTTAYLKPTDNRRIALAPEVGSGTGRWTSLTGAASVTAFGAPDNRWWYPRAYNGLDGKVIGVSANQLWRLDTAGRGAVTGLGTLPLNIGVSGSSVMYAPGKLLVAGGGQRSNNDLRTATNGAITIDTTATKKVTTKVKIKKKGKKTRTKKVTKTVPTVAVAKVASMSQRRNWGNLTVLPNGEVFANGGTVLGNVAQPGNAVYRSEIWNPAGKTWRGGASAQRVRSYHSVSLLMPSGAVFTGGGGIPAPEDNMNAELYYPPYLFAQGANGAVRWASRPEIRSIGGGLTYGGKVTLGLSDGRALRSASLINLAAVTHGYNADQRRIPLAITQRGASVQATLPTSPNALPPGSYLLSVVDAAGVPSPAQTVTISRGKAGTVTVYEPTQATGGGETSGTSPGVVPLTTGTAVSLEPYDQWGYRVRRQDAAVSTAPVSAADAPAVRESASFVVRPALSETEGAVSLEIVGSPGHFLSTTPDADTVSVVAYDGSQALAEAASFTPTTGLTGQFTSLRSVADPDRYLRQTGTTVLAQTSDGSDQARQSSTFAVRPARALPSKEQLETQPVPLRPDVPEETPGTQETPASEDPGGDPTDSPSTEPSTEPETTAEASPSEPPRVVATPSDEPAREPESAAPSTCCEEGAQHCHC